MSAAPAASSADKTQAKDAEAVASEQAKIRVRNQIELLLSRQSLRAEPALVALFDSEKFLPLSSIASHPSISALLSSVPSLAEPSHIEYLITVMSTSTAVVVDTSGCRIRPNLTFLRDTVILRDVPDDATEGELRALFSPDGDKSGADACPSVFEMRRDVANCWFVTFDDEDAAQRALDYLRTVTFRGKPVAARLKTVATHVGIFTNNNSNTHNAGGHAGAHPSTQHGAGNHIAAQGLAGGAMNSEEVGAYYSAYGAAGFAPGAGTGAWGWSGRAPPPHLPPGVFAPAPHTHAAQPSAHDGRRANRRNSNHAHHANSPGHPGHSALNSSGHSSAPAGNSARRAGRRGDDASRRPPHAASIPPAASGSSLNASHASAFPPLAGYAHNSRHNKRHNGGAASGQPHNAKPSHAHAHAHAAPQLGEADFPPLKGGESAKGKGQAIPSSIRYAEAEMVAIVQGREVKRPSVPECDAVRESPDLTIFYKG